MSFVPHHASVGSDDARHTALVLHGILGNLRNWRFYARDLAASLPDWRFVLVDLRNHGESNGAPPPHTMAACAEDIRALVEELELEPDAVLGHSFGGKVAMCWARDHAPESLRQVWVLDSMPDSTTREAATIGSDVVRVIAGLREVEMPLERRRDVIAHLGAQGFSDAIGHWMTTNLTRGDDDLYRWSFDLEAVEEMLESYLAEDLWPWLEGLQTGDRPHVHVLRAEQSPRWPANTLERLEALETRSGRVHLHRLAESGHWVHVDNPDGLSELLVAHLSA